MSAGCHALHLLCLSHDVATRVHALRVCGCRASAMLAGAHGCCTPRQPGRECARPPGARARTTGGRTREPRSSACWCARSEAGGRPGRCNAFGASESGNGAGGGSSWRGHWRVASGSSLHTRQSIQRLRSVQRPAHILSLRKRCGACLAVYCSWKCLRTHEKQLREQRACASSRRTCTHLASCCRMYAQVLHHLRQVAPQRVRHIGRQVLAHHHAQQHDALRPGRHAIRGNRPAVHAQPVRNRLVSISRCMTLT